MVRLSCRRTQGKRLVHEAMLDIRLAQVRDVVERARTVRED